MLTKILSNLFLFPVWITFKLNYIILRKLRAPTVNGLFTVCMYENSLNFECFYKENMQRNVFSSGIKDSREK